MTRLVDMARYFSRTLLITPNYYYTTARTGRIWPKEQDEYPTVYVLFSTPYMVNSLIISSTVTSRWFPDYNFDGWSYCIKTIGQPGKFVLIKTSQLYQIQSSTSMTWINDEKTTSIYYISDHRRQWFELINMERRHFGIWYLALSIYILY